MARALQRVRADKANKKSHQTQAGDGPHQPADVETRRAQHRVQCVALAALEPAAVHAVVLLQVPDGRSTAWRRLSQRFCSVVSDLNLPR